MNNMEQICFAFVNNILQDRLNENGEYVKLSNTDKAKTIEILTNQKAIVDASNANISEDCYCFLIRIYEGLIQLVTEGMV